MSSLITLAAEKASTDWAPLIVSALGASIIGGVIGGVLTTWLRGRIEREEAWRERLIESADAFSKASSSALLLGGICISAFQEPGSAMWLEGGDGPSPPGLAALEKVRMANTEARIVQQRVRLIFGIQSDAAVNATACVQGVRAVLNILENGIDTRARLHPKITERDARLDAAEAAFNEASAANGLFTDACHATIRG